ncbi:hypothetical protein BpHYR1_031857 [Brachionus plicatilis]|uniref:Uncharacterized protein n=1 Tax=Brachionus plicatilis TaxID=10195 RepID=A0A3M7SGQ6_BRAPC|nr:hypothetical protein BpHYR1_031857 [Brachionus plicatilis]
MVMFKKFINSPISIRSLLLIISFLPHGVCIVQTSKEYYSLNNEYKNKFYNEPLDITCTLSPRYDN